MYMQANAANCLKVQLAAPEIMTEHRKSVKCQDFISTNARSYGWNGHVPATMVCCGFPYRRAGTY